MHCTKEDSDVTPNKAFVLYNIAYAYNAEGYSPLTASIDLEINQPIEVQVAVLGKKSTATDVNLTYTVSDTSFSLPVVGLYADYTNTVRVRFLDTDGVILEEALIMIETGSLSDKLPEIIIEQAYTGTQLSPLTLVNSFSHSGDMLPHVPFMFDAEGEVRWYLDYSTHPELNRLFIEVGLIRIANGNFAFCDSNTNRIYEVNLLGEVIKTWTLHGYRFHHSLIELPNGNFVITVDDLNKETIEDVIIEIERSTGDLLTIWDLNESLQYDRTVLERENLPLDRDWFHANGLFYDEDAHALIVSGRNQGVVKLTFDNDVIWILSPHNGWGRSGNNIDLNQFLLTPLDNRGEAIADSIVIIGAQAHIDFDWSWYHHSPRINEKGHLLLFDNGLYRHYGTSANYSRAVQYEIDDTNMTVRQVWDYGKNRSDCYSSIVSSVRAVEHNNSVLFSPGACGPLASGYGKIIEIDLTTNELLFEATLVPKETWYGVTFHSAERVNL